MTRQEVELFINPLKSVQQTAKNTLEVAYADTPDPEFNGDRQQLVPAAAKKSSRMQPPQFELFAKMQNLKTQNSQEPVTVIIN